MNKIRVVDGNFIVEASPMPQILINRMFWPSPPISIYVENLKRLIQENQITAIIRDLDESIPRKAKLLLK